MPLNPFDAIIILMLLLSGILAMIRGFTRETLSILAWVGAAVATIALFPYMSPFSQAFIAPLWLADVATGAAIFIVAVALLSYLSHGISRQVKGSPVGALDHTLGFIFGLARGALLAVMLFLGIGWVVSERPQWLAEARTLPLLEHGAGLLLQLIPGPMVELPEMLKAPVPPKDAPEPPKPEGENPDSPDKTGYKSGQQRVPEQMLLKDDVSK